LSCRQAERRLEVTKLKKQAGRSVSYGKFMRHKDK